MEVIVKKLLDTKNLKKAVGILLLTTLSITFTSSDLSAGKGDLSKVSQLSPLHTRNGAQYGSKRKRPNALGITRTQEKSKAVKKTDRNEAVRQVITQAIETQTEITSTSRDIQTDNPTITNGTTQTDKTSTPIRLGKIKAKSQLLLELLKQKKLLEEKNQNKRNQDELLDLQIIQNLMGDLERYKDTNVSTLETVLTHSLNRLDGKENLVTTKFAIENILANLQKIEDKNTQISIDIQIPKPEVFEQNQEVTVQTSGVLGWVKRHPVLTTGIVVGVVVAGVTVAYFTIPAFAYFVNSTAHTTGIWTADKLANFGCVAQKSQSQVQQLTAQNQDLQQSLDTAQSSLGKCRTESTGLQEQLSNAIQNASQPTLAPTSTTTHSSLWNRLKGFYQKPIETGNCFGRCLDENI